MRRQVKSDAQAHLPRSKIAAVESIGIFGGRKTGVLTHRPRPLHVHRGVWPAQKRRQSRHRVEVIEPIAIGGRVQRSHGDLLRRLPDEFLLRIHPPADRQSSSVATSLDSEPSVVHRQSLESHDSLGWLSVFEHALLMRSNSRSVSSTLHFIKMNRSTPAARPRLFVVTGMSRPARSSLLRPPSASPPLAAQRPGTVCRTSR